jgi:hypothetical protein
MTEFDELRFTILMAIKDTGVPTTKRARSEWAEHVSAVIAEHLRQRWEFNRKPGVRIGPSAMAGIEPKK